jgi:hypothetical protein
MTLKILSEIDWDYTPFLLLACQTKIVVGYNLFDQQGLSQISDHVWQPLVGPAMNKVYKALSYKPYTVVGTIYMLQR